MGTRPALPARREHQCGIRRGRRGLRRRPVERLDQGHGQSGCQQGAIGELLGIKSANMVPLVARLVKQGLVNRARADGRSHALSLTPAGRTRVATVNQLLERHESAIQSRLDEQSLSRLFACLATLRN